MASKNNGRLSKQREIELKRRKKRKVKSNDKWIGISKGCLRGSRK